MLGPICYGFPVGSGGCMAHPDPSFPMSALQICKGGLAVLSPLLTIWASPYSNRGLSAQLTDQIQAQP